MKYQVEFLDAASNDVGNAHDWHESQQAGLGDDFVVKLGDKVLALQDNPFLFEEKYKNTRKALLDRFPYAIFFKIISDKLVLVLAVHHQKKDDKKWKK